MLIHSNLMPSSKLCLIHGQSKLTYLDFTQRVEEVACRLAAQVRKGDRVLLQLADPIAQLIFFYGIIKAGGCCIVMNPLATDEVCAGLIQAHNIVLSITEGFTLPTVTAALPDLKETDLFLGALSSGSTGSPKVIWRDHQSWTSAFPVQSEVFHINSGDILYLAGSLSYTANLNACLHMLAEGGTVVMAGNGLPRTWIKEIDRWQVSTIFMAPANYKMLLKAVKTPLPGIRSLVTAGAKLELSTAQTLARYFPDADICEYYGASELGHVSYITKEELLAYPNSVGKPFPGVRVMIEEDAIWAESPYLAPEYRPKATVGDLGYFDANGYLYLSGRKQGIINSGGVKVIPEQVAAVLQQCPGIAEAVVGGLDDSLRGQRVCAWVVKNNTELTSADILAFCRKKLRPHCWPQKIFFMEELPLNANGKIDLAHLKKAAVRRMTR